MVAETNTELVGNYAGMKDWFEIRTSKTSRADALAIANPLQESGVIKWSDVSFYLIPVE